MQKQINQGSIVESLALPSFSGPTKPVFNAPGGLNVQLPLCQRLQGFRDLRCVICETCEPPRRG